MKTSYSIFRTALITLTLVFGLSFVNTLSAADSSDFTNDVEESITIENWMLSLNEWEIENLNNELFVQSEEDINVESWMLTANETNWNNSCCVAIESEQEVEAWMTDLAKW